MKKVFNTRTGLILFNIGVIIIAFSLLLRIGELKRENEEQQELLNVIADQLIQCNEEVNALYGKNIKLDEENQSLWDNYYMNVSNQEGYEYYE